MKKYVKKILCNENEASLKKLHERDIEVDVGLNKVNINKIVSDLKDTLRANNDIVALCAKQLDYDYRIFCMKFANKEIRTFINPMITKREGQHLSRETNPSIKRDSLDREFVEYIVPRSDKIIAMYQTPLGMIEENIFEGAASEVFEQMVALLDGILISDYGLEILPGFDKMLKKDQQEVIDMYMKWIDETSENINKEIQNDPEATKLQKAIEFMTGVAKGEVKLENIDANKSKEDKNKLNNDATKALAQTVEQEHA